MVVRTAAVTAASLMGLGRRIIHICLQALSQQDQIEDTGLPARQK